MRVASPGDPANRTVRPDDSIFTIGNFRGLKSSRSARKRIFSRSSGWTMAKICQIRFQASRVTPNMRSSPSDRVTLRVSTSNSQYPIRALSIASFSRASLSRRARSARLRSTNSPIWLPTLEHHLEQHFVGLTNLAAKNPMTPKASSPRWMGNAQAL